jgi:hypothetical protein
MAVASLNGPVLSMHHKFGTLVHCNRAAYGLRFYLRVVLGSHAIAALLSDRPPAIVRNNVLCWLLRHLLPLSDQPVWTDLVAAL